MSVKKVARRQYRSLVDKATRQSSGLTVPPEGWIATVRQSLAMSGAELGRRAGLTRARISQAERAELSGAASLKTMQALAAAMGCRFVYAIVPEGGPDVRIDDVIAAQARRKAQALVKTASGHMALESQELSPEAEADQAARLAEELARTLPRGFWKAP